MALNLYTISIPVFVNTLRNISAVLEKGEAFADAKGIPHEKLLQASLIEDMKPLTYQIQRLSDSSKGFPTRLEALAPVSMEDNETTFEQLQERIAKTIDVLESVKEPDMIGKEGQEVIIKTGAGDFKFTGLSYLQKFALPNFYFHVCTAYAILRKEGVDIGKMDYLKGGDPSMGPI